MFSEDLDFQTIFLTYFNIKTAFKILYLIKSHFWKKF